MQRGFVKFWVVRPHAGSAPPLLCHHLGKRQIRARCSSAPPLPGWAPLDPWCTSLGKSGTGQIPWHDATQREVRTVWAAQPDDGAYIHGLYLQGARWDVEDKCLRDMNLKELAPELPVVHVRAIMSEEKSFDGQYECPVYVTALRGGTYVFAANLTTQEPSNKWILSGVALLMTQP